MNSLIDLLFKDANEQQNEISHNFCFPDEDEYKCSVFVVGKLTLVSYNFQ